MSEDSRLLSEEELGATLRTIARYNDILGIRGAERQLRAHIQALTEKCDKLEIENAALRQQVAGQVDRAVDGLRSLKRVEEADHE